jgi:hypothetical protein
MGLDQEIEAGCHGTGEQNWVEKEAWPVNYLGK